MALNTKQSEFLKCRVLMVWLVIVLSMLRIASWVSSQIILIRAYGWGRVSREHLQMARLKPLLVVSNGDALPISPFVHYLIGVAIWLCSTIPIVLLAFKLLPQPYREVKVGYATGWSFSLTIVLFFSLNMLPLKMALLVASILLTVAFLTARAFLPADGKT